ncbi:hypothetical protein H6G64_06130 [Calothrix sp. FACHB-156]|nr:hypothetical protein [Nostoc linckia FACHB-104]MBD2336567.1 hypothetical protein [Calothrix sp. FACHB-156]
MSVVLVRPPISKPVNLYLMQLKNAVSRCGMLRGAVTVKLQGSKLYVFSLTGEVEGLQQVIINAELLSLDGNKDIGLVIKHLKRDRNL